MFENLKLIHPPLTSRLTRCDVLQESILMTVLQGTMDAILCSSGSVWSPPEEVVRGCKREVDEVLRVLKPGGHFFYISFGQPHFRIPHLQRPEWRDGVKTNVLGDGGIIQYFFYEMERLSE